MGSKDRPKETKKKKAKKPVTAREVQPRERFTPPPPPSSKRTEPEA